MFRKAFLGLLASLLTTGLCAEVVPFTSDRWVMEGEEFRVEPFEGRREALYLDNAVAYLEDLQFRNGTIEFDILLPSDDRGFSGLFWRLRDRANGEDFYLRHHQSGNPDANQYTPVFNRSSAWQLYYGPQFAHPSHYRYGEWMHIRIVSRDEKADIYIDSEEPTLQVKLKNENLAGGLALRSGFAPAWFSQLNVVADDDPEIRGEPAEAFPQPTPGSITKWRVSNAFPEADLRGAFKLEPAHFRWTTLEAEDRGYANLARVQAPSGEANTAFARIAITADEATSRTVTFGYSDRVKVFLNGRLLYSGNNGYQSRDYRYLGTIGLFDSLALHLEKGENELLFAVSESFGGWGIMAAIEDRDGLIIEP